MTATQGIEIPYYLQTGRILEKVFNAKNQQEVIPGSEPTYYFLDGRTYFYKDRLIRPFLPFCNLNDALEAAEALADKLNCGFRIERFPGSGGERVTRASFNKIPVTCGCDHADYCYVLGDKLTAENVTKLIIEVLDELERGKRKNGNGTI